MYSKDWGKAKTCSSSKRNVFALFVWTFFGEMAHCRSQQDVGLISGRKKYFDRTCSTPHSRDREGWEFACPRHVFLARYMSTSNTFQMGMTLTHSQVRQRYIAAVPKVCGIHDGKNFIATRDKSFDLDKRPLYIYHQK